MSARSVTPATSSIVFGVYLGDCSIVGLGPANGSIRVVLKDGHGVRKMRQTVTISPGGTWQAGCNGAHPPVVQPGDRLSGTVDTFTRFFNVPALPIAVDRVADTMGGSLPADPLATAHLLVDSCYPNAASCASGTVDTAVTITSGHTWSFDTFGSPDIRGADQISLDWVGSSGDTVSVQRQVPFLRATPGVDHVTGVGAPGHTVHVTARTSAGAVRGTGAAVAKADGSFSLLLRHNGAIVTPRAGDHLTSDLATDAALVIHDLSVHFHPASSSSEGTCGFQATWRLAAIDPSNSGRIISFGTTDGTGGWALPGMSGVGSGWHLQLACGTAAGDVLVRTIKVP